MEEQVRTIAFRKKRVSPREEERRVLLEGLAKTRTLIAQAYSGFNTAGTRISLNPTSLRSTRSRRATPTCCGG